MSAMDYDERNRVHLYSYKKVRDMTDNPIVKSLVDYFKKMESMISGLSSRSFCLGGEFTRNLLFGKEPNVIDLLGEASYSHTALSKDYSRRSDSFTRYFQFEDKKLYIINPHATVKVDDQEREIPTNDPSSCDFTINLGVISLANGWLYAPPITLMDVDQKILRPPTAITEDRPQSVMYTETLYRGIRFALEFDLTIHQSVVEALKILCALENQTTAADYQGAEYAISDMEHLSPQLKQKFFETLVSFGSLYAKGSKDFDYLHHALRARSCSVGRSTFGVDPGWSNYKRLSS